MPRAEIYLADEEGGANVRFVYPDGFNPTSGAHQLSNILRLQLDQLGADGVIVPGEVHEEGDLAAMHEQLADLHESQGRLIGV